MMRFSIAALFLAILTACASGGGRPPGVGPADVDVRLSAPLNFGAGTVAPASFEVAVKNQSAVPIRVRRIRLSSLGGVMYAIRTVERNFDTALAAGESTTFTLLTSALASRTGVAPSEPMNLRTDIDFEADGRRYRDVYNIMALMP